MDKHLDESAEMVRAYGYLVVDALTYLSTLAIWIIAIAVPIVLVFWIYEKFTKGG